MPELIENDAARQAREQAESPELERLRQAMEDAEAAWNEQKSVTEAARTEEKDQQRNLVHRAQQFTQAQKAYSEAWHAMAQESQCPVKAQDALAAWEDPDSCEIWARGYRKDQEKIQDQADRCGKMAEIWEQRAERLRDGNRQ